MFTLHVDDSGTHQGSPVVVLAGFISSPDQWEHFDREWSMLLREFGIAESFHMADFESRHGIYEEWDNPRRKDFVIKMTGIIRRRCIAGIAASCPTHNYQKLQAGVRGSFASPYALCAGICWQLLGDWADARDYSEPVAVVCEAGTIGRGEVMEQHARLLRNQDLKQKWRVGPLVFDTKESLPLQAADFFAYETYKRMCEIISGGKRERLSIQRIIDGLPLYAWFIGDESVDDIIKHFG